MWMWDTWDWHRALDSLDISRTSFRARAHLVTKCHAPRVAPQSSHEETRRPSLRRPWHLPERHIRAAFPLETIAERSLLREHGSVHTLVPTAFFSSIYIYNMRESKCLLFLSHLSNEIHLYVTQRISKLLRKLKLIVLRSLRQRRDFELHA